jgi:hypothetical protein
MASNSENVSSNEGISVSMFAILTGSRSDTKIHTWVLMGS